MHTHETSAPSCASIDESTDVKQLARDAAEASASDVAARLLPGKLAIGSRVEHMGTGQRGLVMRFCAPAVEVYFADIDTSDWVDAGALRVVDAPVSP